MRCVECRHGRPFAEGAVNCVYYGMIIRAEHECTLKGKEAKDEGDDQHKDGEDGTEAGRDGAGAA